MAYEIKSMEDAHEAGEAEADRQAAEASIRAADAARDFPTNTCGASRHVQMIGEYLARGQKFAMLDEEPEYVGRNLLSTVESLWKARTEIFHLREALAKREKALEEIAHSWNPEGDPVPQLAWCHKHAEHALKDEP